MIITIVSILIIGLLEADYLRFKTAENIDREKIKNLDMQAVVNSLQPGDFIVSWGSGFFAYVISRLVFLKDGVSNAATHNMHVHEPGKLASAEPHGYRIIDAKKRLSGCRRFIVYRFHKGYYDPSTGITATENIKTETLRYIGKKYDYFQYIIAVFRVAILFIPLFLILENRTGHAFIATVGLFIAYYPVMSLLNCFEGASVACSEVETLIYTSVGLLNTVSDATQITPQNNYDIFENLEFEVFKVIDTNEEK